jgi:hypothetical protein
VPVSQVAAPAPALQSRKSRLLLPRCFRAWLDRFHDLAEIRGPERAEFRLDQHVTVTELLDLSQGFLADEYRQHLLGDRNCGLQLIEGIQGKLDIHSDNDVNTHVAHDIDRQVADETAVDQQVTIKIYRREHAGHGHARPDRAREIAFLHDVHFAGLDVGCNGPKRYRQVVEVGDA